MHLRPGLAQRLQAHDGPPAARATRIERDKLLLRLVDIQYERNDIAFERGEFRVRGDVVEVWPGVRGVRPAHRAVRRRGRRPGHHQSDQRRDAATAATSCTSIPPSTSSRRRSGSRQAVGRASARNSNNRLEEFREQGKLLEAQRLSARTRFDMEMLVEVGHCPGIENYARWFSGKAAGEPPYTLLDFFPRGCSDDRRRIARRPCRRCAAMFAGDHSRKTTLVEHGFRLPSALDNRPLGSTSGRSGSSRCLFMSATPGPYELEQCGGEVVEQVIRPTGLVDPVLHVRPARGQVPDLIEEIKKRAERKERVLVTTLTKRHGGGPERATCARPACAASGCTPSWTPSNACRSCASCAKGRSTCWSASTCCAKGSICRRCRWSPFSTPTRRASCAARRR